MRYRLAAWEIVDWRNSGASGAGRGRRAEGSSSQRYVNLPSHEDENSGEGAKGAELWTKRNTPLDGMRSRGEGTASMCSMPGVLWSGLHLG
jgi:hypothetical protein